MIIRVLQHVVCTIRIQNIDIIPAMLKREFSFTVQFLLMFTEQIVEFMYRHSHELSMDEKHSGTCSSSHKS